VIFKTPSDVAVRLTPVAERKLLLEELLTKCVSALAALLESPDLNLECLEQATRDAIAVAHETLQEVKMALNMSA
jgi:hypothetical protein